MLTLPEPATSGSDPGGGVVARVPPIRSAIAADIVRALRPHQWVKNVLLFAPIVLAHKLGDVDRVSDVLLGFLCFSLCASAGYVINDLNDRAVDRDHPTKRPRPFASGALSAATGIILVGFLAAGALTVSGLMLPPVFTAMLLLYLGLSIAYSFRFKKELILDVLLLAGLYTFRVLAGGAAADVPVTLWLLIFSFPLFVSLAIAKRFAELARVEEETRASVRGRPYRVQHMSVLQTAGPLSGYLAVLVLAAYVNSLNAAELYARPVLLWLLCPLLVYWVRQVWLSARRHTLSEDPVMWAVKDRRSIMVGCLAAIVLVLASGPRPLTLIEM